MKKAEVNADIGRIFYQAETDAAGYPNGMPYWPEMKSGDKYYYALLALDFLDKLQRAGFTIAYEHPFGLDEKSVFGEGDCKDLMEELDRRAPGELEEFHKMLEQIRSVHYADKKD